MSEVANELSFMEYVERTVYELQRLFRTKPILECYPVIGILIFQYIYYNNLMIIFY